MRSATVVINVPIYLLRCRFRTSLRSGTIMESSKLPFLVWYKTMFLMSCTKKGFSTNELQKQLGLKRYEPVWAMVHKLRRAMGNRDARYTLEGMIELDEGYFSVASKEIERGKVHVAGEPRESRTLR